MTFVVVHSPSSLCCRMPYCRPSNCHRWRDARELLGESAGKGLVASAPETTAATQSSTAQTWSSHAGIPCHKPALPPDRPASPPFALSQVICAHGATRLLQLVLHQSATRSCSQILHPFPSLVIISRSVSHLQR